jgi:hypothetical protein
MLSMLSQATNISLTSKFSYLVFWKRSHKTKVGTPNRWETTKSKPHGPTIMIDQLVRLVFITSSLAGAQVTLLSILLAWANCAKMLGQNHFAKPNPRTLIFLHRIFMCRVTYSAPVGTLHTLYHQTIKVAHR